MSRPIPGTYDDPLDLIWRRFAARIGWRITRDPSVYASWDGAGTLSLCPVDDYDPDDSLAQMVLHEACHALIQGRRRHGRPDWGLDNTDDQASAHAEHACHRLQAALLDRYGLRSLLAVTTDWRPYWDALPDDPLAPGDDPAITLAAAAWPEARRGPWGGPLDDALRATAALADTLRSVAPPDSLWSRTQPRHPTTGLALAADGRCGSCAWRASDQTCLAAASEDGRGPEVAPSDPACLYHETRHTPEDCAACGACCREGYHAVAFGHDEPLAAAPPPGAIPDDDVGWLLPRPKGRCVLLSAQTPWRCQAYAQRPDACRDFAIDGPHCLVARRRVGRSRR